MLNLDVLHLTLEPLAFQTDLCACLDGLFSEGDMWLVPSDGSYKCACLDGLFSEGDLWLVLSDGSYNCAWLAGVFSVVSPFRRIL